MIIDDNTEYVERINKLIPRAEAEANKLMENCNGVTCKLVKGVDGKDFSYCIWTNYFHKAMNRLAREYEIRNI